MASHMFFSILLSDAALDLAASRGNRSAREKVLSPVVAIKCWGPTYIPLNFIYRRATVRVSVISQKNARNRNPTCNVIPKIQFLTYHLLLSALSLATHISEHASAARPSIHTRGLLPKVCFSYVAHLAREYELLKTVAEISSEVKALLDQ